MAARCSSCSIAQSASKFSSYIRLLPHLKEVDEPFESGQIGSSAMAYKRNPMRSERICALARFVHALAGSPRETHGNQWLERTLDDSANRRLVITEAFLATDAILNLVVDISAGLVVNPAMLRRNMADELPFMATENVLMRAVEAGGDRQALHERIRVLSLEAAESLKAGRDNDLIERMRADPELRPHVQDQLDPGRYVGRAPAQVDDYLGELEALLTRHAHRDGRFTARVRV